jgi:AcrR family transcriptional regulator
VPKIVNHDDYRQKLLEKSFYLITRKGFNNVSMKEIAAEIGVSTGTLYHYFPSKEKMLADMISWAGYENTEEYIKRTSSVESVRDRFDMIVDFWKEKGKLYEQILLLGFDMYRNADIEEWEPLYTMFAERYTAGMSDRLNISRQFARSIFIYFLGLSFHSIATNNTDEYNKQIDFLDIILRPLIVEAPKDIDKAVQKVKEVYKTFLANSLLTERKNIAKKIKNSGMKKSAAKQGKAKDKTKQKQLNEKLNTR